MGGFPMRVRPLSKACENEVAETESLMQQIHMIAADTINRKSKTNSRININNSTIDVRQHLVTSLSALISASIAASVIITPIAQLTIPTNAHATTVSEAKTKYDEANEKLKTIQQSADDTQKRLDDINAKLPESQDRAANAIREMYKTGSANGAVQLQLASHIIGAKNISEAASLMQYDMKMTKAMSDAINEYTQQKADAESTKSELDAQLDDAQKMVNEAQQALSKARDDERSAIAAKNAAASATGDESSMEISSVDWSQDKTAFVDEWGARIDRYLSGSPIAGTGKIFAAAAYDNGVDPRVSPAISCIESGKGRAMITSTKNLWGWGGGTMNMGSTWEQAIYKHVQGWKAGYGTTVTPAMARKYCPPNAANWYRNVVNEMNKI